MTADVNALNAAAFGLGSTSQDSLPPPSPQVVLCFLSDEKAATRGMLQVAFRLDHTAKLLSKMIMVACPVRPELALRDATRCDFPRFMTISSALSF